MLPNQQEIYQRKGLEMVRDYIFSAITALILTGCIETSHNFMIRFNDIEGLRKNDQVFFDKTPIGVVTDVEYTDIRLHRIELGFILVHNWNPRFFSTAWSPNLVQK